MWLGTLCGGVYLIWFWKKWALAAVPVLIAGLLIANPLDIRERAVSALVSSRRPDGFQQPSRGAAAHRLGDDQGASLARRGA